jgi:hypothetical protein
MWRLTWEDIRQWIEKKKHDFIDIRITTHIPVRKMVIEVCIHRFT